MRRLKIKVCGMKYKGNIEEMLSLAPDYLGLIFFPGSKRYVESLDADWVSQLSGTKKTGVFVDAELDEVRDRVIRFGLQAVQLHGAESAIYCEQVKALGVETIKAFGLSEGFDWGHLTSYADAADYYLFDTKTPDHGGSGRSFDWSLLADYEQAKPFFLSGGLQLDNLQDALALADGRLYGLDLNSKFESQPGLKDLALLNKAFQIIRHE